MRIVRFVALLFAACASAAWATPAQVQQNGSSCVPSSNACTTAFGTTLTSADAGNIGLDIMSCSSGTITAPAGWTSVLGTTNPGTADFYAVFQKQLVGAADQSPSTGCNGTKASWCISEWGSAGTPIAGANTTGTASGAASGSVTYSVPSSGGVVLEIYQGRQGGAAATSIADSPPSSPYSGGTTASCSVYAGTNSQVIATFFSAGEPFSATQPYTNSATWNHTLSVLGSVDIYIPAPSLLVPGEWWPPPFNRILGGP